MLFVSSFILNESNGVDIHEFFPKIHNFNNSISDNNVFESYKFPDINPSTSVPDNVDFSMAAGEFLDVYGQDKEEWNAIATCFFIDTAHNIIEYIETIYQLIKPGGLWVNIGPLLYHYTDDKSEISIELSWEQVSTVIQKVGFVIEVR